MSFFYIDRSKDIQISWDELLEDIKKTTVFNPICHQSDYYEVFKQIIISLILGREIVLLDNDFTSNEIESLLGKKNEKDINNDIAISLILKINSKNSFLELLNKVNKNWRITLFTSGTTGVPKKVSHTFDSITRFVRSSSSYKLNIWGLAYNPTHMAGVQVFFQALMNGNTLVRLFGLSKDIIFDSITKYNITHISATPTFYRLLLPSNKKINNVLRITSGGEKFDKQTINQLKNIFPAAKITNIYASTEAGTLLIASGNNFSIKHEMKDLVKIDQDELIIHKSLMGNNDFINEEWYRTGDVVKIVSKDPLVFQFISRKNEMINVGGYKVNPNEVEETMRTIDGVKDVRVFAKENSVLGNVICCEVIVSNSELNEYGIRKILKDKLQEFKIPRVIKFVEEMSLTRTGKIKR